MSEVWFLGALRWWTWILIALIVLIAVALEGAYQLLSGRYSEEESQLKIIPTNFHFAREDAFVPADRRNWRDENGELKNLCRRSFLIGVENVSSNNNTIKNVELRAYGLSDPEKLNRADGLPDTGELKPGETALYCICYLDQRKVGPGYIEMETENFEHCYHNAQHDLIKFPMKGEATFVIGVSSVESFEGCVPIHYQLLADNCASVRFRIELKASDDQIFDIRTVITD